MKNLMFWLTASLVLILFWNVSSRISEEENELSFTQFMQRVEEDKVTDVRISGTGAGSEITGTDVDGKSFKTFAPEMEGLVSTLLDRGINVEADDASRTPWIVTLLSWLPILLIVGLFFFLIRQMQAPGNRAMSFGRSRAKLTSNQQKKVTFKDVAGVDEPKEELQEIIDFLELEHIRKSIVGTLSYGLRKRVELGRALALEPSLLLLDEPMAGMNIEEKEDMARYILDIHELQGTTIMLIEHDIGLVMDISHHIAVIDFGVKIGEGSPDEISQNEAVIAAYLGEGER